MSPTCYTTRDSQPFSLEGGKILTLRHNLFDNDAIVLEDMCKAVTLKSKKSDKQVRVEYPDMNYLGLWHAPKTEAPLRLPGALVQRSGLRRPSGRPFHQARYDSLKSGEAYENSYVIRVK